jgi:hypothetical protein
MAARAGEKSIGRLVAGDGYRTRQSRKAIGKDTGIGWIG